VLRERLGGRVDLEAAGHGPARADIVRPDDPLPQRAVGLQADQQRAAAGVQRPDTADGSRPVVARPPGRSLVGGAVDARLEPRDEVGLRHQKGEGLVLHRERDRDLRPVRAVVGGAVDPVTGARRERGQQGAIARLERAHPRFAWKVDAHLRPARAVVHGAVDAVGGGIAGHARRGVEGRGVSSEGGHSGVRRDPGRGRPAGSEVRAALKARAVGPGEHGRAGGQQRPVGVGGACREASPGRAVVGGTLNAIAADVEPGREDVRAGGGHRLHLEARGEPAADRVPGLARVGRPVQARQVERREQPAGVREEERRAGVRSPHVRPVLAAVGGAEDVSLVGLIRSEEEGPVVRDEAGRHGRVRAVQPFPAGGCRGGDHREQRARRRRRAQRGVRGGRGWGEARGSRTQRNWRGG